MRRGCGPLLLLLSLSAATNETQRWWCTKPNYTRGMVIHEGLKFIWCPNAKVGTTSLYELLHKTLNLRGQRRCLPDFPGRCEPFRSMATVSLEEQKTLCNRGFFTFTFVRSPFDRVLSAYLDKIGGCWSKGNGEIPSDLVTLPSL